MSRRHSFQMFLISVYITTSLLFLPSLPTPLSTFPFNRADDLSKWVDLNETCSDQCSCPNHVWHPVCGSDHVTYISPCLAGCQSLTGKAKFVSHMLFTELSWKNIFYGTKQYGRIVIETFLSDGNYKYRVG